MDEVASDDGDDALEPRHEERRVEVGLTAQQGLVHKHHRDGDEPVEAHHAEDPITLITSTDYA